MLKFYIWDNKCHSLINKMCTPSLSEVYEISMFKLDYVQDVF